MLYLLRVGYTLYVFFANMHCKGSGIILERLTMSTGDADKNKNTMAIKEVSFFNQNYKFSFLFDFV